MVETAGFNLNGQNSIDESICIFWHDTLYVTSLMSVRVGIINKLKYYVLISCGEVKITFSKVQ